MGALETYFPVVATKVNRQSAAAAIEMALIPLETAESNLNVILNKRELRETMGEDEQIDLGLDRNKLLEAIRILNQVKTRLEK
jgi:hypothetical protein